LVLLTPFSLVRFFLWMMAMFFNCIHELTKVRFAQKRNEQAKSEHENLILLINFQEGKYKK